MVFFENNNKRTTLVDNNTWNNSHIAMVGKAMASNEDDAYTIMQELGVDYVLVIFGGLLGNFEYRTRIVEVPVRRDLVLTLFQVILVMI